MLLGRNKNTAKKEVLTKVSVEMKWKKYSNKWAG